MVLMSASSATEDTRPLMTDPRPDSSNGFQGRSPSHFTMQKQRPAYDTLPNLDYINSCKTRPYILEQTITSVTRGGKYQRSWSDDSNTVQDDTLGLPYNLPTDLAFHRRDKPVVQKSISESGLRKRRPGHYKNDYASNLIIPHHDGLTSDGLFTNKNNIPNPDYYNGKVLPVQSSLSSPDCTDRNVSGEFVISLPDHQLTANVGTSVSSHGQMNQYQQLNGATLSCYVTDHVPTTKPYSVNMSNITLNTPGPIFDQFGVLIGSTTSSHDMSEDDKAKTFQKTNFHGFCSNFQTSGANNGHSKTVRSSSYPMKLPPTTVSNSPNMRRQSMQSFDTSSSLHAQNSGNLSGIIKAKTSQVGGIGCSFQTSSTNNGHSKTVRSSSFPLKSPPTTLNNVYDIRRQSVQSFDTSLSRRVQNNANNIHSDSPFCFVPISNANILVPHGSHNHRYLQRTLSDGPRACVFGQMLAKSQICGETDSEYVTLDQRYELPQHSRMNWTTGATDITTVQTSSGQYRNGCTGSLNDQRTFKINNKTIKTRPFSTSYKLLTSSNGKHTVGNDILVHPSMNSQRLMNGTGTLKSNNYVSRTAKIGIGRTSWVPSSSISSANDRNNGRKEYLTKEVNSNTGLRNNVTVCESENRNVLKRCQSLPDLQDNKNSASEFNNNYSDDEDGDDFGFLSYPISFSSSCPSAAMNKAKSPSPGTRIFPKRWRNKSKAVPAVSNSVAMWTPGPPGSCSWSSVSGRKVQLRPVSILNLSEPERMILQKIALSKLQSMDIGCPVSIPNENSDQRRTKKSLSLKRRSKSVTSSLDLMVKEGTASGLVFGIPLAKCLLNDKELDKRRNGGSAASAGSPSSMKMRTGSSDNLQVPRSPRKSSSSSQGSLEIGSGKHQLIPSHKRAASIDSLPESECSRNTSSSLIDALSLPASNPASRLNSLAMDGSQQASQSEAQVPHIVKACFRHIETYGLQTLGIFRVGSSKKRVKQLREEFDSGKNVHLTDEHNPHDVGALLKEYFRDLPDPLLTRELYLPFLYAERMKDDNKRHLALRLLISMLPVTNRDTLWALLQFLATVSQHATDKTDEKGEMVAGNKMDAHNLATLFGPNIIHRTKIDKSSDKEMMSESAERVEQSKEIIEVVKDMIDNHHDLFEISGELRDEILRLLVESNQEVADRILRHIANQNQIETDPESMCSVFEDSANSPTLYHSMNSDADLLAYAQRQTSAHQPLRITKSADDSLDSPVLKSRVALLSESQAFSPASKDNHMVMPLHSIPSVHRFNTNDNHSSPLLNRVPVLRVYPESAVPDSGRSTGSQEYPCSEGFNKCLNIPRPLYFRESSSSSISSDLSSLNGHGWSENGFQGQWALPTPPTSRSASPKALFQSTSSSSTLIASPAPSLLNHPQVQDVSYNYKPTVGSAEWERDRWKHWEKIAAQKKKIDTEQETLV